MADDIFTLRQSISEQFEAMHKLQDRVNAMIAQKIDEAVTAAAPQLAQAGDLPPELQLVHAYALLHAARSLFCKALGEKDNFERGGLRGGFFPEPVGQLTSIIISAPQQLEYQLSRIRELRDERERSK